MEHLKFRKWHSGEVDSILKNVHVKCCDVKLQRKMGSGGSFIKQITFLLNLLRKHRQQMGSE